MPQGDVNVVQTASSRVDDIVNLSLCEIYVGMLNQFRNFDVVAAIIILDVLDALADSIKGQEGQDGAVVVAVEEHTPEQAIRMAADAKKVDNSGVYVPHSNLNCGCPAVELPGW
jgi:hypothetical protein